MQTLTIPARDVQPGDVFDVCATTFGVPTVTAIAVQLSPRNAGVLVATDHGEPLVFLHRETVTVHRP